MSATRIFIKLLILSGSARTLSVTVGLSGVGPPPTLTIQPRIRDLNVPRRALAVAQAQNAAAKDLFVVASRSLDVGDSEKMRDGETLPRGHLIAVLFDLYAH